MNKKASVSVIIPCYNAEKTIERALDSILFQSQLPYEIIIIDDKSIDGSCAIIKDYIKRHEKKLNITLIELKFNSGPAKARNVGWDYAESDYIAFLDADDSWHPHKIELQYSYMQEHPDVSLTGHLYEIVNEDQLLFHDQKIEKTEVITKRKLLIRNRFSTPTVMVKRNIELRFRDLKKYSEDYRLWLEIVFTKQKAIFLYSNLCFLYKNAYGSSGLSSNTFDMWYGELDNYTYLYRNGNIDTLIYSLVLFLSFLKLCKRLIFILTRNISRNNRCVE